MTRAEFLKTYGLRMRQTDVVDLLKVSRFTVMRMLDEGILKGIVDRRHGGVRRFVQSESLYEYIYEG